MRRSTRALGILIVGFCLATACSRGPATRSDASGSLSLVVNEMENPAQSSSAFPNLTTAADGSTVLSWLEPSGDREQVLRFAVRRGENWSETRPVTVNRSFNKHPAVLPAVMKLTETAFVSYWTQVRPAGAHAEDVYATASRDGGKSWTEPLIVHRDRSESEHSLVSMAAMGPDRVAIAWLDGREEASSKRSMLMETTFDLNGVASPESILDPDVCSCCPTSIERTASGLLVAYRDRHQTEQGDIRDISILRFESGRWSEPSRLNRDGWRLDGCPTNGVDVAADRSRIAVAWFTAANGPARVKLAFSNDGGGTFTAPQQVDTGLPVGRASIALLSNGVAVIAWVERQDSRLNLMVRGMTPDGQASPAVVVASDTGEGLGYPRIEAAGDRALAAWVSTRGAKKVHTALVSVKGPADLARHQE
ncbi:MAG TPA: sialidase family protein [Blastocatellia bacterium]|nr:sialidase family protein [Blastocatellia bacterium]